MSQIFNKLNEIEGQINGEIRQIDKKMKDLRLQRQKLTGLQRALKPRTVKRKKVEAGSIKDNQQNNS